jgi:hypothetical protein
MDQGRDRPRRRAPARGRWTRSAPLVLVSSVRSTWPGNTSTCPSKARGS